MRSVDILCENGWLDRALAFNEGGLGELPFVPVDSDRRYLYVSFVNGENIAKSAGIVIKIQNRNLEEWEEKYLRSIVESDFPAFVLRYWKDIEKFSVGEFINGEHNHFSNGTLEKIIGLIKEFIL